ncbi:LytTR family DNA-binding domain-containing protein [Rhabdobacter roseus]|uniref:DNA-binding LytR/AlgR family response regulator n=1 Tax=Rhabdobacter roseus TaxID=1655419 RepID=A0A840TRJ5_9BACT|nr:LytTR family DNA-binding domain-containing protein [Rhabdobacter roseus]MBB5282650.1 DNA-binding LytR/AlgR family response regulator [Rhabdobacter roseus]
MHRPEPVKCLIVDDEPPALEVLKTYLKAVPSLRLVGECTNALEAFQRLREEAVDVLFLDIQMPQLKGTELVRSLKNPPKVIFTTAHREYALDGFELDAVDYLLKPFSFDRFLKAVDKLPFGREGGTLSAVTGAMPVVAPPVVPESAEFLYFRSDRKMVKVFLHEILYLESLKDYVRIVTQSGQVITKQPISSVEEMLPERSFRRIHRSYLVSLDKVTSFTATHLTLGSKELPIGKLYKHEVEKALRG